MPYADELRLLFTLGLTALVFASAYALSRRFGAGGRLQAACDALLLGYVVQYLSVALPGSVGWLNVTTMTVVAAVACAACWIGARAKRRVGGGAFVDVGGEPNRRAVLLLRSVGRPDRLGFLAAALFVVGYIGAHAFDQRWFPIFSTDPLVYHVPEAVQWLQTGRLGLFDTWYWNPAATYSPATTSTFIYWLLAPMRNDTLARWVQVIPLLLIFGVVARLSRILGTGLTVAGLAGAAAALCRPLFSQVLAPKDDLLVTASFACAVLSLAGDNPRDRLGPWRAALAFGMVLASKYTILMMCPLFLFMIDAPFRAIWGRTPALAGEGSPATSSRVLPQRTLGYWLLAILIALALSMPWYVRTWLVTGNPLFPIDVKLFGHPVFQGLFTTERDASLRSTAGVRTMLTATYHSLPLVPLTVLVGVYLAAIVAAGRTAFRDPLRRACMIGAPVTLAILLLASPHHEVRYVFPILPLVFAAAGFAMTRLLPRALRVPAAVVFAGVSVITSFAWEPELLMGIASYAGWAALVSAIGAGIAFALSRVARRAPALVPKMVLSLLGAGALLFLMAVYVYWAGFVQSYRAVTDDLWTQTTWPEYGGAWHYVRSETPPDATIAFANTAYIYPLYGFDFTRKVVYAPVRSDIKRFTDLPRLGDTVPGDLILDAITRVQTTSADRATWLANLDRLGVQFVYIHKHDRSADSPEMRFAKESKDRLEHVYEDDHAVVYRVVR